MPKPYYAIEMPKYFRAVASTLPRGEEKITKQYF